MPRELGWGMGLARRLLSGLLEMTSAQRPKAIFVTIVGCNQETKDGLQAYLQRAGVASSTTRALGDPGMIPAASVAAVLFPDDFESAEASQQIIALRAARPRLQLVVVTREPHRLSAALGPRAGSLLPVVLPKLAFGWTILDASRGQAFAPTAD